MVMRMGMAVTVGMVTMGMFMLMKMNVILPGVFTGFFIGNRVWLTASASSAHRIMF